MKRNAVVAVLVLVGLIAVGAPDVASAQGRTAEVVTWDGQTLRLTDAVFEVYFTVAPPPKEGANLPDAEKRQAPSSGRAGIFASLESLRPLLGERAEMPRDHHRTLQFLTLRRGLVDFHVPVERMASVTFARFPVASTLPPYVAPAHLRYAASVLLADGSRVDGDYVNLGATYVRGRSGDSRVDIPWEQVTSIRFVP